ncbi:MAG: hypothetical protein WAW85_04510 [Gordonia sp. (in: high G+C Gram-positive bacteria)]|uniref:hypothetical protein n=1 Tax=Gordonia sp. (in: high G+C Gram-positive bacteria) TaxID=84139 RepID=UPI003BB4A70F
MRISTRIGLGAAAAFAAAGLTAGLAGAAVTSTNHTATGIVKDAGRNVEVTVAVAAGLPEQTCTIALAPAASASDQDVVAKQINTPGAATESQEARDAHARLKTATLETKKDVKVTAGTPVVETLAVTPAKARKSYAVSVICESAATTDTGAAQHASTMIVNETASATPRSAPESGQTGNGSLPDSLSGIVGDLPGVLTGILDGALGSVPAA